MSEQIIIRKKVYRKGELVSKLVMLTADFTFDSADEFMNHYGESFIMRELFGEEISSSSLKESFLYDKYLEVKDTKRDNDYFMQCYKLNKDLAIDLSEHIYLHHITSNLLVNEERIIPWDCIDSKIYIADTWWSTDEEILHDVHNMSFLDFIMKYKAF